MRCLAFCTKVTFVCGLAAPFSVGCGGDDAPPSNDTGSGGATDGGAAGAAGDDDGSNGGTANDGTASGGSGGSNGGTANGSGGGGASASTAGSGGTTTSGGGSPTTFGAGGTTTSGGGSPTTLGAGGTSTASATSATTSAATATATASAATATATASAATATATASAATSSSSSTGTATTSAATVTGTSGTATTGEATASTSGSDGTATSSEVSSSTGAGTTGGGDLCEGLVLCETPGWSCDANMLVTCALNENGCLRETRMGCGAEICLEAETAECVANGSGEACDDVLIIQSNTIISGSSFVADFGDEQSFEGDQCSTPGAGSSEAVFAVTVPAGVSVQLSERGELFSGDDIDAVFGFQASCSDSAPCLGFGDPADWMGATFTAEEDSTVFAWVAANGNVDGDYHIQVDYLENLGSYGVGATVPVVDGGPLDPGEAKIYQIELTETATLYGTATADTGGDIDVLIYNGAGLWMESAFPGEDPETFAAPLNPGKYRIEVFDYDPVSGYSLELFTDPITFLSELDVGDSFSDTYGAIPAGRSHFFAFELLGPSRVDALVTNTDAASDGDPDLVLYQVDNPVLWFEDFGPVEAAQFDRGAGSYLLEVVAYGPAGDVPAHQFDLEVSEVP